MSNYLYTTNNIVGIGLGSRVAEIIESSNNCDDDKNLVYISGSLGIDGVEDIEEIALDLICGKSRVSDLDKDWGSQVQAYAGNTKGISRLLAEVGETPSSEPPPSGYASYALKCPTQEKRNVVVISVKTAPSFMALVDKACAKSKISKSELTRNAVDVAIANLERIIPTPIKNKALVELLKPIALQLNHTAKLLNTLNKEKNISQEELEETLFDIVDSIKAGKDLLAKTKLSTLKGGCCEN